MNLTLFTLASRNKKTGFIPVSTSSRATCPNSCPLKSGSCYASNGSLNIHWQRVTKGLAGIKWNDFLAKIRYLPRNQLWRHNQAGDLPGKNNSIDSIRLKGLVKANSGKRGFTYTHKPVLSNQDKESKKNAKLINFANQNGFTINLSANNLTHADSLKDLGIGPVATLLPSETKNKTVFTPKGNKVIVCPATYREHVNCANCGLCAVVKRSVIIGFPSHGSQFKIVDRLQKI